MTATLNGYGDNVFRGSIALPYLEKEGLSVDVLKTNWAHDNVLCDKVSYYSIVMLRTIMMMVILIFL
jgi:hypothetical protein